MLNFRPSLMGLGVLIASVLGEWGGAWGGTAQASLRHAVSVAGNGFSNDFEEKSATTGAVHAHADATSGSSDAAVVGTDAGLKKVSVIAQARKTSSINNSASATGWADKQETLTFHASNNGVSFNVTIEVEISGELGGSASCPIGLATYLANVAFTLGIDGKEVFSEFALLDNNPASPDEFLETRVFPITINVTDGTPIVLTMGSFAHALAGGLDDCTASAEADISNTFKWMGVVSVTDEKGNPVKDYTLTDEYGQDWTTPALDGDITSNGVVDVDDLLALINAWGECAEGDSCIADIVHTGFVDVDDLLAVINEWT